MHTITAEFRIFPGKEAEAEAAIRKVVEGVQANEPGALKYIWHRGVKDPLQVLVFEIYRDDEARTQHGGSDYLKEFQSLFGTVFDPATVKITRFDRIAAVER
ncbi:MAG TPA: antibiotic biosynthesis monooxygenase [Dehalococcoidia bacterium]|jgi:quinol monooxygenase YgiN|nr:antibiotic biosynthesis monooxygenase [Dehalococcoidia bacterium]